MQVLQQAVGLYCMQAMCKVVVEGSMQGSQGDGGQGPVPCASLAFFKVKKGGKVFKVCAPGSQGLFVALSCCLQKHFNKVLVGYCRPPRPSMCVACCDRDSTAIHLLLTLLLSPSARPPTH